MDGPCRCRPEHCWIAVQFAFVRFRAGLGLCRRGRRRRRHGAQTSGASGRRNARAIVMSRIDLPAQPRILVVALRLLGDVLLTTPLIRSLRRAWPDAKIDALVFADTAGILGGNPDLDGVGAMPARATAGRRPGV